jgi:hypothetical protein
VTDNYLKVRIPPGRARNEWVRVRVRKGEDGLSGEIVADTSTLPARPSALSNL